MGRIVGLPKRWLRSQKTQGRSSPAARWLFLCLQQEQALSVNNPPKQILFPDMYYMQTLKIQVGESLVKRRTEKQKVVKITALFFSLTLLLISTANLAFAKDITLTWTANQESDIAWYNVYFRTVETQETWQEPGPAHDPSATVVSHQILGLDETRQHCFKVTALTDSGAESPFSEEACTTVPDDVPETVPDDVPETVAVTSPNGIETLVGGSVQTLTWTAPPNAVTYRLRYSIDNGATWEKIDTVSNINSYNWKVPNVRSRFMQFKVTAKDANGAVIGRDQSDAAFTVKRVRVTSPNGAETLEAGAVQALTWASSRNAVSYVLRYSTDSGTTWELIDKVSNINNYNWKVPNVNSSTVLFKVTAKNAKGKRIGKDQSDTAFTIILL